MRMFRFFFALALICGLSSAAKADQADFRLVILDPDYITHPIFSTPYEFSFAPCVDGQLPTNVVSSYQGCFSGVNRTGNDWVGVEMVVSNTDDLGSQPASCALDGSEDIYSATNCGLSLDESRYILNFSIGNIPNNGTFVIAEDGVDPSLFPTVSLVAITSPVPEPSSLLFLSTGFFCAVLFLLWRNSFLTRLSNL
ncbi:hypothetical protein [Edaphobacter modestus]|uniref:Putative secreted protein with PEP-CTERM sorting signal n=1 Tax=Edaphobacter modestus TaxID=388466 RepID=A0A4V2G435_9BACT|nr:hypothetical protein [Edaphobacter modestus]RZU39236.1 putative secreted protein with PEP-CTERM sorting signal [Edaphobacter modestus]